MTRSPLLVAGPAGAAAAEDQELLDALRAAFQSLAVLGETPGIPAPILPADEDSGTDLDIGAIELAASQSSDVGPGLRPHLEGAFGHPSTGGTIRVPEGMEDAITAAEDSDTVPPLAGPGVESSLARGWVIRPIESGDREAISFRQWVSLHFADRGRRHHRPDRRAVARRRDSGRDRCRDGGRDAGPAGRAPDQERLSPLDRTSLPP
jgi:hypothetical protein